MEPTDTGTGARDEVVRTTGEPTAADDDHGSGDDDVWSDLIDSDPAAHTALSSRALSTRLGFADALRLSRDVFATSDDGPAYAEMSATSIQPEGGLGQGGEGDDFEHEWTNRLRFVRVPSALSGVIPSSSMLLGGFNDASLDPPEVTVGPTLRASLGARSVNALSGSIALDCTFANHIGVTQPETRTVRLASVEPIMDRRAKRVWFGISCYTHSIGNDVMATGRGTHRFTVSALRVRII